MSQRPLNTGQKQRQQAVRTLYSQAQQYAAEQKEKEEYSHILTSHFKRMECVVGLVDETIEFYSVDKDTEEPGVINYDLLFIRRSIKRPNALIGNIYQEFLFSQKTGNLIFFYNMGNNLWADEMVKAEYRCYFNENGSFSSSNVKLSSVDDASNSYFPEELQDYDGSDAKVLEKALKQAFKALTKGINN